MKKTTHPEVFNRYVTEKNPMDSDKPRQVTRRFHGREVPLWFGYVNVSDIEGYVENLRLRFYLKRWQARNGGRQPSTDDVYKIMVEADSEESRDSARPFQVERMAGNVVRNGVREPLVLCQMGGGHTELWDGNRRFFGTKHIMSVDEPEYVEARSRVQWLPAYVYVPTGDAGVDGRVKHDILVECNFVEPEQISWPAYVKAEQIYIEFTRRMRIDPDDPVLSRQVKDELRKEFGLKGWRLVDRWIKMYNLALEFKEYQEVEKVHDPASVDLHIQEHFEYFDELSKPGVFGALRNNPDARDAVFDWLWDGKFKSWTDVRYVPKIMADPTAWRQANEGDSDAVKRAIGTVIANDPVRVKDKTAANEKIKQFAAWLDSFKREEYRLLDAEALGALQGVLVDVVKITRALRQEPDGEAILEGKPDARAVSD